MAADPGWVVPRLFHWLRNRHHQRDSGTEEGKDLGENDEEERAGKEKDEEGEQEPGCCTGRTVTVYRSLHTITPG